MKYVFYLTSFVFFFFSCTSPEEYAKEQHRQDSLWEIQKTKMFAESNARQKAQDSIFKAHDSLYFEKFKTNKKAYAIYLKHPDWGTSACEKLAQRLIWIGMSLDMVKYLRGLPDHVNVSNYGNGKEYQWCWTGYTPSCFYGKADCIITAYN